MAVLLMLIMVMLLIMMMVVLLPPQIPSLRSALLFDWRSRHSAHQVAAEHWHEHVHT